MKKAFKTFFLPIAIIAISLGVGFLYDYVWDKIDLHTYPREYSEHVEKYAKEYGIPEYVIYSTIKVESNFESGAVSSKGDIGLMQISPDTFEWLQSLLKEELDEGMLYDPETNIKYGTYLLSFLFDEFGDWNTVHAAYNISPDQVKEWLETPEYAGENGELQTIPHEETKKHVKKIADAALAYQKLYY